MILIIEPHINNIVFRSFDKKSRLQLEQVSVPADDNLLSGDSFSDFIREFTENKKITAISFRIPFGGEEFCGPVAVDDKLKGKIRRLVDFYPLYIPFAEKILEIARSKIKDIPMFAFFETSFFLSLPEEERFYALPFELSEQSGIKKWGFHGLYHSDAFEISGGKEKVISIVLDKKTTVSAIENGKPKTISMGYTPLEGVMSGTTCGDIDPGIVFYLLKKGDLSLHQIDDILKNKSGFYGITGFDAGLEDLVKQIPKHKKIALAFEVYRGQIIKYVGEALTILSGADAIVFSGKNIDSLSVIIHSILKQVSFMGVTLKDLPWKPDKKPITVSSPDSKIAVHLNPRHFSNIILDATLKLLRK